ncbi:MAG: two-component regulator propeller domain-containing protein [Chitinophagaceae bacterium]
MKPMLPIPLLLLMYTFFTLYASETAAQPYYFRHYQVENGLSNNTVNCSAQDKNGFLWFGTKEGLNRFDGYRFKLFNTAADERSLYPDNIFALFSDDSGRLWVGSQKGLYWFDAVKERLVRFIDSIPEAYDIQTDKSGHLWFLSHEQVFRYDFKTKLLKEFTVSTHFHATSLCMTANGTVWVATAEGFLQQFDSRSETFHAYDIFSHSSQPTSRHIQKIKPAGPSGLYIGTTSQGLKHFDLITSTYTDILTYNPDKTTIFVRDILDNGNNEFWFATESGIFISHPGTGKFINLKKKFLDPYSITDNAVYSLCRDKEGGIWAGTFFGGLNYYPTQHASFQKYFPDNTNSAISGNAVREICEDSYGNLWIGTEDAGLNKLNKATGAITHFKPSGNSTSIAYTNIHGLLVAGNNLWIGTFEHGLDVMDIPSGKVKKRYIAGPAKNELKSNFTLCLIQTRGGDIYIGTNNGFHKYKKNTDDFEQPEELPVHLFVGSMIEDHSNTLWIATHGNGIYAYNPVTRQTQQFRNNPDDKNSITNNDVNAIYEDSNHTIWLSTEGGGLCKLGSDRKTITRYTTKNGLPSNFIFKVLEDNQKNLWVTTSKGLINFNPALETVNVYTRANGLLSDQFNYHSGYKDAAGTLYFGSVKGMISFSPDKFTKSSFIPPVYITGFQVHNKELDSNKDSSYLQQSVIYTNKITLPYNQSSFSIDFAALSFISPEMTEYSYIMEGLDKEWTYLKSNRKVYFTNLSPGTYVFKIRDAMNGQWNKNSKELTIKINPPFWATYYAYLLYAVIFIGIAYYLIRSYLRRIDDKKEKEIYEAKIDFFTIVAHEIRTPLTLIKGPVENLHEKIDELPEIKEDVITLERNTNRLVTLITQILDFRQTEKKGFSVDFTRVDITEVVKEEYLNFMPLAKKRNLECRIRLPQEHVFAMADEEALHKIFSNLFSNAVKYAGSAIQLRLLPPGKDNNSFTVEISNDGYRIPADMREKIFEPFYRLKETIKQKGTGIGLALARSLAELHNGRLYLKDTKDEMNTFVLHLPVQPEEQASPKQKKNRILLNTK